MKLVVKISVVVFLVGVSLTAFGAKQACENGETAGHPCQLIDLQNKLKVSESGIVSKAGSDVWGWTDPATSREYAIMGLSNKAAFVDISDPANPTHLGDLPSASTSEVIWRDIKTYQHYAFIVSEGQGHGMQVFDLHRLRNVENSPARFSADAHYDLFGSAHNIVINEKSGFAYVVGSNTCDAGMHIVDIRNPLDPQFSTCVDRAIFDDVGNVNPSPPHGEDYTHDAQCINYIGPDTEHQGKEICVCSNADTVNIIDVTDKASPSQISVKRYSGLGYTHQGWLTEDQRYFILGDELDEVKFGHKTKTLIWDMADLENPEMIGSFFSSENAIDHNMYVRGNLLYQSNYDAGLRILALDQVGKGLLTELAYFDTEPTTNEAAFTGAWSVYPYFPSQNVVVSNIDGYLYVLTPHQSVIDKQ